MSIITKGGDHGQTGLMFGHRVDKTDIRIEALGALDELTSALGLARSSGLSEELEKAVEHIQNEMIGLMGLLGCLESDRKRYREKGFSVIGEKDVEWIDSLARELEAKAGKITDWIRPGSEHSFVKAAFDFARAVARRAERRVWQLNASDGPLPEEIMKYLNRLSDLLWLMARVA